jgi:hypothetical protein
MAEENTIEISDALEKVAAFGFDEAMQTLTSGGELIPFTVLLEGENLYIETHPGETPDECYESARKTVTSAEAAIESYVFVYDGYVDLDEGEVDAIICEAGDKGEDEAYALCLRYEVDEDGEFTFDEAPAFIDMTQTFFENDGWEPGISDIPEAEADEDEEVEE